MKIKISIKSLNFENFTLRSYNPEEEDVRSILMDICQFIDNQVDFKISGFGQDNWPVDSGIDLAVFLEQLPDAIKAVKQRKNLAIDFYEQGIERHLKFSAPDINGMHQIACTSYTSWKPDPEVEKIHNSELLEMLYTAKITFIKILTELSPNIINHPWIVEWKSN